MVGEESTTREERETLTSTAFGSHTQHSGLESTKEELQTARRGLQDLSNQEMQLKQQLSLAQQRQQRMCHKQVRVCLCAAYLVCVWCVCECGWVGVIVLGFCTSVG